MNSYKITLLPGDGIGPEITNVTQKILKLVSRKFGFELNFKEMPFGGSAIDLYGDPFPNNTFEECKRSDAVLLAAIGDPKYDALPREKRPETGLLTLKSSLDLFANIRPVKIISSLTKASSLKEEYVREVPLEKKIWTEAGFAKQTYNSSGTKTDTQTLQQVSIWPIGYNVVDEERLNQRNRELEYSGGYSLFRANNSHMKPAEKGYLLKDEFIYKVNTPGNLGQNTELGFGWLGGKPREGKYSVYNYLGITSYGIITNTDTEYSPDGLGKSYYVQNVKDNLYGIKALNPESNLFEHYYQSNEDGEFTFIENLSKTNPKQHWEIIPIRDEKNNVKQKDDLAMVHLKNKDNGKFFSQNFDAQGLNNESESDGSSGSIFVFQSYNGDIFN